MNHYYYYITLLYDYVLNCDERQSEQGKGRETAN